MWAFAHKSCPLGLWLTLPTGRSLIADQGWKPRERHHADRRTSGRARPAGPPRRSSARSGNFAAPRRPRNRPSAASSSMTASWCRACATAPRSRPARSTRSAPICSEHRPAPAEWQRRGRGGQARQRRRARADIAPPGFRFFDNRQKYLLFVSTCSEKTEIANRVSLELVEPAAVAAGAAAVRCRRRRRHRAVAGDARAACALSDHAALRRRQGNLLRRRAHDAGEDGGPPVRASGDRAGRDQSLLRRGAVADAALGDLGAGPDLEGRRAVRQHRARLCRADRRARRISGRELARRHQPPRPAIPSTSGRSC